MGAQVLDELLADTREDNQSLKKENKTKKDVFCILPIKKKVNHVRVKKVLSGSYPCIGCCFRNEVYSWNKISYSKQIFLENS